MPTFKELLDAAKTSPEGTVQVAAVSNDMAKLESLYQTEGGEDAARIMASVWARSGSGALRKAAVKEWAKDKGIVPAEEDKPDETGKQPPPKGDGDGAPAPRIDVATAAGDKGDQHGKHPGEKHGDHHHAGKHKHAVINKLRAIVGTAAAPPGRMPMQAGQPDTAGAYRAGFADSTKMHGDAIHRVVRLASRHAFQLGMAGGDAQKSAGPGDLMKSAASVRFADKAAGYARRAAAAFRAGASSRDLRVGAAAAGGAATYVHIMGNNRPPPGMGTQADPVTFGEEK